MLKIFTAVSDFMTVYYLLKHEYTVMTLLTKEHRSVKLFSRGLFCLSCDVRLTFGVHSLMLFV